MEDFIKHVCQFLHCRLVFASHADLLHHIQRVHADNVEVPASRIHRGDRFYINPLRMSPFYEKLPNLPPKPIGRETLLRMFRLTPCYANGLETAIGNGDGELDQALLHFGRQPLVEVVSKSRDILLSRMRRLKAQREQLKSNGPLARMRSILDHLRPKTVGESVSSSESAIQENRLLKQALLGPGPGANDVRPSVASVTASSDLQGSLARLATRFRQKDITDLPVQPWFKTPGRNVDLCQGLPLLPRLRGPLLAPYSVSPMNSEQLPGKPVKLERRPEHFAFICQEPGCNKRYKGERRLRQHIKDVHGCDRPKSDKRDYKCSCNKVYKTITGLQNHMKTCCPYELVLSSHFPTSRPVLSMEKFIKPEPRSPIVA